MQSTRISVRIEGDGENSDQTFQVFYQISDRLRPEAAVPLTGLKRAMQTRLRPEAAVPLTDLKRAIPTS